MAGYIGNSPTPVPLTSADLADSIITSAKIADGTIASADLASNAVDTQALSLFNATGSAPVYACRAWVNFNGTGAVAIREDGNITSITDNGTGDYTVNFTTSISDANYAAVCTAGTTGTGDSGRTLVTANANATGSCRVNGKNSNTGTLEDFPVISAVIIR